MKDNKRRVVGMIFAAGRGTRLVPFTLTMPKALVPVGGVPMLGRVIGRFADAGITDIVINIHHHADKIRKYLSDNNNFGLNITLSDESDLLLDTGGGILHARRYLEDADAILVHNADILTDLDLNAMIDKHIDRGDDATLLVADRSSSRYLYFDPEDMLLRGWQNVKTGQKLPDGFTPADDDLALAFGGVHVLSPGIFKALRCYSDDPVFSITPFYVAKCRDLKIGGYVPAQQYQWFDIGTPDKLQSAEQGLKKMLL